MRRSATLILLPALLASLALAGCRQSATEAGDPAQAPPAAATPATTMPAPASTMPAPAATSGDASAAGDANGNANAGFDPTSVPESTATLPPFPFFDIPAGMESTFDEKDKIVNFDRQYFMAGDKPVAIEGRIFHDRFNLTGGERKYTKLEFMRNYENAVTALGGVKINTTQYTYPIIDAAGRRDELEKVNYAAPMVPDYQHDSYLIRQGGKEYWIEVSVGSFPDHGYVVVLEREGMKQSLGFLDASAMKQAIDKDGRVALHINFDVDKATLRPDAQPVIEEIGKLLNADPALKLSIEGHTDNTGTPAHNQELSTARARSVLGALVGLGVDPARLSSKGFGQDKPVADNASEAGRAQNRRVELVKTN